jgi:protein-S-isoprenylcysteine O-methyltransferase Ste14
LEDGHVSRQLRARRTGVGTVVVGVILILIGGYYVFRETLGMNLPPLEAEKVVPVLAVIGGFALLYRAWRDRDDATREGSGRI